MSVQDTCNMCHNFEYKQMNGEKKMCLDEICSKLVSMMISLQQGEFEVRKWGIMPNSLAKKLIPKKFQTFHNNEMKSDGMAVEAWLKDGKDKGIGSFKL